eukprot:XP_001695921.1 predicted protein [Chlamydomonas reinhardtii]
MGSDFDINGSKNGVILCSAIEYAYEHQRICFSKGMGDGEFILHVLDKWLLDKRLSSVGQHKNDTAFAEALGDLTFRHIDNKHVKFKSATGKGPYKRALALHANFALEHCATTYPEGFDPTQYTFNDNSQHEGKEELVKMWLSRLDTGSVAEGCPLAPNPAVWRRRIPLSPRGEGQRGFIGRNPVPGVVAKSSAPASSGSESEQVKLVRYVNPDCLDELAGAVLAVDRALPGCVVIPSTGVKWRAVGVYVA